MRDDFIPPFAFRQLFQSKSALTRRMMWSFVIERPQPLRPTRRPPRSLPTPTPQDKG